MAKDGGDTANRFRPELDSTKTQMKLISMVCILPVSWAISTGKTLEGELTARESRNDCVQKTKKKRCFPSYFCR